MAIEHLYNVTDSVVRHLTTRVIKSKKTFRPRGGPPAGAVDGARHSAGRPTSGYRGRTDAAAAAKPLAPNASVGGATEASAAPAAGPAPAPTPAPEGGTPA